MAADNHSGGFVIHSEKVDGTINIIAMLFGKVDISEGNIYGLTITKTLNTSEGNLIVKISSPGPVPISNLSGKTMGGLSLPKGICKPEQIGYICFEDVTMTLSEQQADSISIPNASVETCYEHECPENKPEETETVQAEETEEKSLNDLSNDFDGLQEQLQLVEELLEKAKTIETTINDEQQPQQLKKLIESLGEQLNNSESLIATAQKINRLYGTFNENATEMAVITGVVIDMLQQMEKLVEENDQYLSELEEALHAFEEQDEASENGGIDTKQFAYLQSLADEYESEDEWDINELQKQHKEIKDKLTSKQSEVNGLEENANSFNESLSTFYTTIHNRGKAITESQHDTDDEHEAIASALDVAEPNKFIEKQIKELILQSDESDVNDDLTELETLVSKAFEQVDSSTLPVKLLEEIANLMEEIEATLDGGSGDEDVSGKFKTIEKQLTSLSELVNLPEEMADTYKLTPLLEDEKHQFRLSMKDNIERWQQLPKIFSGDSSNQLEQLVNVFNNIKEQIATLKEQIEEKIDELEVDEEFKGNEDGEDDAATSRMLSILDRLTRKPTPTPNQQSSAPASGKRSSDEADSSEKQSSSNPSSESKSHNNAKPVPPRQEQQDNKQLQQQIADALREGQQHVNTIRNTTEQADTNLNKIEQTSTDLTRTILGRHAIKVIPSGEFDTNLRKLENHVNRLDNPVKALRRSIENARKLLGKQANTNRQLSELEATLQEVTQLNARLKTVRQTLDTYPDYVVFVNTKRKNVDHVLKKFDTMLN